MQDEYNDQTAPVEETPGYVGHVFDEFVVFEEGLKPLDGFDFSRYGRLADEIGLPTRLIEIDFGHGAQAIEFEAYSINEIIASLPFVDAIYDCPPNQGPAGGAGHIFVLDEGHNLAEVAAAAKILRSALDADLASLENDDGELTR
jgi:hypothetical protein